MLLLNNVTHYFNLAYVLPTVKQQGISMHQWAKQPNSQSLRFVYYMYPF